MDALPYKDYVLGLRFVKCVSDVKRWPRVWMNTFSEWDANHEKKQTGFKKHRNQPADTGEQK
jgi:hypothetical protein